MASLKRVLHPKDRVRFQSRFARRQARRKRPRDARICLRSNFTVYNISSSQLMSAVCFPFWIILEPLQNGVGTRYTRLQCMFFWHVLEVLRIFGMSGIPQAGHISLWQAGVAGRPWSSLVSGFHPGLLQGPDQCVVGGAHRCQEGRVLQWSHSMTCCCVQNEKLAPCCISNWILWEFPVSVDVATCQPMLVQNGPACRCSQLRCHQTT